MPIVVDAPPICPQCGNNMCYLNTDIYAQRHLTPAQREIYDSLRHVAQAFLQSSLSDERKYWLRNANVH